MKRLEDVYAGKRRPRLAYERVIMKPTNHTYIEQSIGAGCTFGEALRHLAERFYLQVGVFTPTPKDSQELGYLITAALVAGTEEINDV